MLICYKQYTLKSRHEFAWAQTFEAEGIPWEYETMTFRAGRFSYTPDFLLYSRSLIVEIKVWGATRINRIDLCTLPLLLIFGLPERHYIRLKPAGAARVLPGHFTSWQDALQKVAA